MIKYIFKGQREHFSTYKSPGPDGFICECHQTFQEEFVPRILKPFQKLSEEVQWGTASKTSAASKTNSLSSRQDIPKTKSIRQGHWWTHMQKCSTKY